MRLLLGENVGVPRVRANLDEDFANEALLWTMIRSYLKNKLISRALPILNKVTNHQIDELSFVASLSEILDYFADDFQKTVLSFLSSYVESDSKDTEIELLKALVFSDLLKYGGEIKALVTQNVPDISENDDVFSEVFSKMLLDWRQQVALELIDHLKMAGHLEFMHRQALREHTRNRLDVCVAN